MRSRLQAFGNGRADDLAHRLTRQPLIEVLGLLLVAGAAKGGYGAWATGGILAFFPMYFGVLITFRAIHTWRQDAPACRCPAT